MVQRTGMTVIAMILKCVIRIITLSYMNFDQNRPNHKNTSLKFLKNQNPFISLIDTSRVGLLDFEDYLCLYKAYKLCVFMSY